MYLLQQRNERCISYPTINSNPRYHFDHLLFTNGNGVEFVDGNPVNIMGFTNRAIPWTEYYKQEISFNDTFNLYIDRHMEDVISKAHDEALERRKCYRALGIDEGKDTSSMDLWIQADKDAYEALNKIEELTYEMIMDTDFWYSTFFFPYSYYPHLCLYEDCNKLAHFTANTEASLVEVAVALIEAYIRFYEYVLEKNADITQFKPSLSHKWNKEDIDNCLKTTNSDLAYLKEALIKLKQLHPLPLPKS